jgi:hypothetical protein
MHRICIAKEALKENYTGCCGENDTGPLMKKKKE